MLVLILFVLWSVSNLFLVNDICDAIFKVKDSEISSQGMSHNDLAFQQSVYFFLCNVERLSLFHMMRGYSRNPCPEICYPAFRLNILIVQHMPIVVDNWNPTLVSTFYCLTWQAHHCTYQLRPSRNQRLPRVFPPCVPRSTAWISTQPSLARWDRTVSAEPTPCPCPCAVWISLSSHVSCLWQRWRRSSYGAWTCSLIYLPE